MLEIAQIYYNCFELTLMRNSAVATCLNAAQCVYQAANGDSQGATFSIMKAANNAHKTMLEYNDYQKKKGDKQATVAAGTGPDEGDDEAEQRLSQDSAMERGAIQTGDNEHQGAGLPGMEPEPPSTPPSTSPKTPPVASGSSLTHRPATSSDDSGEYIPLKQFDPDGPKAPAKTQKPKDQQLDTAPVASGSDVAPQVPPKDKGKVTAAPEVNPGAPTPEVPAKNENKGPGKGPQDPPKDKGKKKADKVE